MLPETARRLEALLDKLIGEQKLHADSHICFVDDGSQDRTWALVTGMSRSGRRIGGIRLSHNRGHQHALLAGLLFVKGDLALSIDADLQDDLGAIEKMLDAHAAGADMVFGVRSGRKTDTFFKRATAHIYYQLVRKMGIEIVHDHADFRLMSRRAIEALREYEETNLFLRALVVHIGFRTAIVEYERSGRLAGSSKYTLRKMLSLALHGITSFSTQPLRAITILGFIVSTVSFLLGAWALAAAVIFNDTVAGWASTVIPIYMICGVQMLCLGVIGEYVGKIYIETKRRPRFHIEEVVPENREPGKADAPD